MAIVQKVNEMIEALLLPADIEIYDIELNAGILKVTINSKLGINIDELADINSCLLYTSQSPRDQRGSR